MRRFIRPVALALLLVMLPSASDWPYLDEISDALGSQLEQATVVLMAENDATTDEGTTPRDRHALQYELLLLLQGVVSAPSQIPPVDPPFVTVSGVAILFRSALPEVLYRPPIFAPIV